MDASGFNDTWDRALQALRAWSRGFPLAARVAGLLLAATAVGALLLSYFPSGDGQKKLLLGGLEFPSAQLPAVEAAFAKAGLGEYEVEGNRLRVPFDQAPYVAALADADALPLDFGSYYERAVAADKMFESRSARDERLKAALQKDFTQFVRAMQGIENASVLYDVEEEAGRLVGRRQKVTATVIVKPTGAAPLDPRRVPMIRNLIAGAIAGLAPHDVTVADQNGRTYAGGAPGAAADPLDDAYYARKQMVEQQLAEKICQLLQYVPGVNVQVTCELDPEIRHVEQSVRHEPSPDASADGSAPSPGDHVRKSLADKAPEGPLHVTLPDRHRTGGGESETTGERGYASTRIERELQGLTPRRVRVSVSVPSEYYRQVWSRRNRDAAQAPGNLAPSTVALRDIESETTANIKGAIAALLPPVAGQDALDQVTVTPFESLDAPVIDLPSPPPAVGWSTEPRVWVAAAALLLLGLLVIRPRLTGRRVEVDSDPATANPARAAGLRGTSTRVDAGSPGGAVPGGPSREVGPSAAPSESWAGDLGEQVREDPGAAATVVRHWMGKAG